MPKFERIYWSKKFDWRHYSKLYDKYCKTKDNYYAQSSSELLKNKNLGENSKVVDLGCGTGALTSILIRNHPGIKIFAIDLSKEMLYSYRKNFEKEIKEHQIEVIEGNAETINKYTKEKYDIIFISSALWDMNIEILFKNCRKILKKNGLIILNLPALVVEKEKGFIFFIEHFFRQTMNSKMIYRRIKIEDINKISKRYDLNIERINNYSFNMSKENVAQFFDLLRYRYPFILFPEEMPYKEKLKKCTEIFKESLRYIPKEGIKEYGFVFVVKKI